MNDEISRREWVAIATGAATATTVVMGSEEMPAADQTRAPGDQCPFFDQPLFCKGKKYCQ
jgi:hypothetical protein